MSEGSSEKLLITCREATFLITQKQEVPIGLRNSVRLMIHLLICEFCRRFSKQTRLIENQVKKLRFDERLTEEEKREMEKQMESGGKETL